MWTIKSFSELSVTELHAILKLRVSIFVVDQNRIYQEVDDDDLKAHHIFESINGQIAAYARIFKTNDGYVTIGRVVTNPVFRGQGFGLELMTRVLSAIKQYYNDLPIKIYAQEQVEGYYKKFRFESQGESFTYLSTPHILMTHPAMSETTKQ